MTELILMRHGSTEASSKKIYCGCTDLPLNHEGILEAERSARKLAVFHPSFVYTSDMLRAQQTASIVAPKMKPICLNTLRELDFGAFEGLNAEEIGREMPEDWQAYMSNYMTFHFPGGESVAGYLTKSADAVNNIVKMHDGERILIVAHKGLITSALSWFLHQDHAHMFHYDIRLAGFAWLRIYDGFAVLHQLV